MLKGYSAFSLKGPSVADVLTAELEAEAENEAALETLVHELERLVDLDRVLEGLNSLALLEGVEKRSIADFEEDKRTSMRKLIRKQRASCSQCQYVS